MLFLNGARHAIRPLKGFCCFLISPVTWYCSFLSYFCADEWPAACSLSFVRFVVGCLFLVAYLSVSLLLVQVWLFGWTRFFHENRAEISDALGAAGANWESL